MKTSRPGYRNIHQDIIDRCRNGERAAQFEIYGLYYRNMYNISLRIVNDPNEAEDIMQEAFLSAFEKLGSYRGEVSFGAWMKRIVINRSLDFVKKKKIELVNLEEDTGIAIDETDNTVSPEDPRIELINKCIRMLPDGFRIILSLYLVEGYDHEEIGKIMGITSSTSRSQYARAKQKLCKMIRELENKKPLSNRY